MSGTVLLKKGEGRSMKKGGLWIYDNEIKEEKINGENGSIVDVLDFDGYFLGSGFINVNSKIRVRMLTRRTRISNGNNAVTVNTERVIPEISLEELIEKRLRDAWQYRKDTVDTGSCRLIFGEADFLPGIVIDKFSDVLVVESLALGIDRLKPAIIERLKQILLEDGIRIRGVYERSDARVREEEGMERTKGFIGPEFDTKILLG